MSGVLVHSTSSSAMGLTGWNQGVGHSDLLSGDSGGESASRGNPPFTWWDADQMPDHLDLVRKFGTYLTAVHHLALQVLFNIFSSSLHFLNACDIIMDLWNTRKDTNWFLLFSFELTHKRGAKLYPYSDIIALLIFMFPKMNNFCCSATVVKRNRRYDPQKHCDCRRAAS